jgi:hypothetical protein
MAAKETVPALGLESFSCPHVECGAIAHQSWFKLYVAMHEKDDRPWVPGEDDLKRLKAQKHMAPDVVSFLKRLMQREVFLETHNDNAYLNNELMNVHASKCYSCKRIALWRADELIYPINHVSIAPNEGMPADVKADFLEANENTGQIASGSSGAAAIVHSKVDDPSWREGKEHQRRYRQSCACRDLKGLGTNNFSIQLNCPRARSWSPSATPRSTSPSSPSLRTRCRRMAGRDGSASAGR